MPDIGATRMRGLSRLVIGGLYLLLFVMIIAPLLFVVGLVLAVLDIAWQILTNREGIPGKNLFEMAYTMQFENARWALTGAGEFQLALW